MSLPIGTETTVGAMIEAYPELESVLVEMAPAFASSAIRWFAEPWPRLRRLEQAPRSAASISWTMILRLRNVTGQSAPDLPLRSHDRMWLEMTHPG
jgi:hypothetical protein